MKNKARDGTLFNSVEQNAYNQGHYIGKARKNAGEFMGSAHTSGHRGRYRLIFNEGLEDGYSEIEHNGAGICERIRGWTLGVKATWQNQTVTIVKLWAPGDFGNNSVSLADIANDGNLRETVNLSDLSEYRN